MQQTHSRAARVRASTLHNLSSFVGLLLTLGSLMLLGIVLALHVVVTNTPSEPIGLYWDFRSVGTLHYGDLVSTCIPASSAPFAIHSLALETRATSTCPGHLVSLVKEVVGLPGDRMRVTDAGIERNGHLIALSKPLPSDGTPMPRPAPSRVAAGTAWVYSPLYVSFDSRYFGAVVPLSRQIPIWVITPRPEDVDRLIDQYNQEHHHGAHSRS